ncbi:unnamed protein product [Ectocarpus sp. 12 AP-2014]
MNTNVCSRIAVVVRLTVSAGPWCQGQCWPCDCSSVSGSSSLRKVLPHRTPVLQNACYENDGTYSSARFEQGT